ncbi:hypothetical protein QUB05_19385 [Microcoleus sp. F10-C6]|uniref:hypothetical protein n=1 Tax=unclassified Microcoleus TaxID=2642155 RepID=UPI002FCFC63F
MTEPAISYRRIDRLKAIAFDRGFTNEDAKQFGKLSKTATWEALLELYLVDGETLDSLLDTPLDNVDSISVDTVDTLDWTNDGSYPVCFARQTSTSFLDWVDLSQLVALVLASAGVFVLAMSLWRQINPLNLFPPVRVNIQIGTKL